MPCVDFNTFIQKLPADCKEFFDEDCCRFTLPKKIHTCPACGSQHACVDKYRDQALKGIADTKLLYIYHARRYRCSDCGKTFAEENPFIDRYQRMPKSVIQSIVEEHGELVTASHIARRHNVSPSTVMRHFAKFEETQEASSSLPAVLSMDEFRGNVGAKYQVVFNDLEHRSCCAILKDRTTENLYRTILE